MEPFTGEYHNSKHQVPVERHVLLMESQIKELKKGNDQLSVIPTIIVIVCTSFFPSFSCPWPNVCAGNCSVISQHLIQVGGGGVDGGYLTKKKGGLFFED